MKKNLLLLASWLLLLGSHTTSAQPSIAWQKCLGGSNNDESYSIRQTTDGGYISSGFSMSNNGDVTGQHGGRDGWVTKTDGSGNLQWQQCFGGTMDDYLWMARQTAEGGYITAGHAFSTDGDCIGNHGSSDMFVLKLDNTGGVQWKKCLGGFWGDIANCIQQTADGGYIVAGGTASNDGDVSGNHGLYDFWLVKLNNSGTIQWQKCFGGTQDDRAYYVQQTSDGGYIVAGDTQSNNGDVTGNHGSSDFWVIKTDSLGILQWQKCFGGTTFDFAYCAIQSSDGGYVIGGRTYSINGDVTGNHGNSDVWVIKLNSAGSLQWQKCLGGEMADRTFEIQQTTEGGYICVGETQSNNADVTGNHGLADYWVVKLFSNGNIEWQLCLGGTDWDTGGSIQQTSDNGYILIGGSFSVNGDITGNHGNSDFWIVKLSSLSGVNAEEINSASTLFPNPFTTHATIKFPSALHSATFWLYNLYGQLVMETSGITGESFRINAETLGSGVYVYEVTEKDKKICGGKAVVY